MKVPIDLDRESLIARKNYCMKIRNILSAYNAPNTLNTKEVDQQINEMAKDHKRMLKESLKVIVKDRPGCRERAGS